MAPGPLSISSEAEAASPAPEGVRTHVLIQSRSMGKSSMAEILTLEQIAEMRESLSRCRAEAVAAMYRTDGIERPYHAGRGKMYRLWNLIGQALELLDPFTQS